MAIRRPVMKALYFSDLNKVDLREVPKPEIKDSTDVIVKVTATSICGSDVHIIEGLLPTEPGFVLGHECTGVVEAVGDAVTNFKAGDRVVGPPLAFCGECEACKAGHQSHCMKSGIHGAGPTFGSVEGVHAEFTRVPFGDACLRHIPEGFSDEEVLLVSDIGATGYTGVKEADLKEGESIVVFGCGPVGLCGVLTSTLHKPKNIIAVEMAENRLAKAKTMGATHTINAKDEDVLARIGEITGGRGADVVIDAVGLPVTLNQGMECLGVNGRLFLVGIPGEPVSISPQHFYKNPTFSMGLGNLSTIDFLLDQVKNKSLDFTPLITHTIPLDEIVDALDLFRNRPDEVIKVVIKP